MINCEECKQEFNCKCSLNSFCKHQVREHLGDRCSPYKIYKFLTPGEETLGANCSRLASNDLPQSISWLQKTIIRKPGNQPSEEIKNQFELNSPLIQNSEIFYLKNGTLSNYSIMGKSINTIQTNMRLEHGQSAICVYNNKVYFIGGGKLNMPFMDILVLNTKNNTIKKLASITTPRFMPSCVVFKGNLYIIGGNDNVHQVCKSIEIVNILSKKSLTIPLNISRKRTSATVFEGYIYICARDNFITIFDPINQAFVREFEVNVKNKEILALASCSCSLYIIIKNWIFIIEDSKKDYNILIPIEASFDWTQQEVKVFNHGLHYIDYFSNKIIQIHIEKKPGSFKFLTVDEENLNLITPEAIESKPALPSKSPLNRSDAYIADLLAD